MSTIPWVTGTLREIWDDLARTCTVCYPDGTMVESTPEKPNPRPYTAQENAVADATAARASSGAQQDTYREAVRSAIVELQAEKDRCNAVIAKDASAITGGDTKDIARAAKRIADAAIDIARLLDGKI